MASDFNAIVLIDFMPATASSIPQTPRYIETLLDVMDALSAIAEMEYGLANIMLNEGIQYDSERRLFYVPYSLELCRRHGCYECLSGSDMVAERLREMGYSTTIVKTSRYPWSSHSFLMVDGIPVDPSPFYDTTNPGHEWFEENTGEIPDRAVLTDPKPIKYERHGNLHNIHVLAIFPNAGDLSLHYYVFSLDLEGNLKQTDVHIASIENGSYQLIEGIVRKLPNGETQIFRTCGYSSPIDRQLLHGILQNSRGEIYKALSPENRKAFDSYLSSLASS